MIKVESNTISKADLVGKREQVRKYEKAGFSKIVILHFMSKKNSVSWRYQGEDFVITLS